MRLIIALLSGGLFGLGLVVSDMINPARVLAFLNLGSGQWDPTLAFVMAGGMLPMLIAWRVSTQMEAPVAGQNFPSPPIARSYRGFIAGATLFGVGWGLVGICPGPAFSALLLGGWPIALFIAAMLVGMVAHRYALLQPQRDRVAPTS